ncbi:AtuA-related protein [Pseudonocardia xishanensis]|uniref:AtuA-like ferredoxin-fold domain-containing protein n=1 Tax=Pseudonocardia xishanensis TaxID=630995 RepID=A0ABP8RR72_9PSEU
MTVTYEVVNGVAWLTIDWLRAFLTADTARALLGPEAAELPIEVHALPNLRALNVVVHGILGEGVASSTRPDPRAKGLGEYLRSRVVPVPEDLLGRVRPPGPPGRAS